LGAATVAGFWLPACPANHVTPSPINQLGGKVKYGSALIKAHFLQFQPDSANIEGFLSKQPAVPMRSMLRREFNLPFQ